MALTLLLKYFSIDAMNVPALECTKGLRVQIPFHPPLIRSLLFSHI